MVGDDDDDDAAVGGAEWASRMAAGGIAPRDDAESQAKRAEYERVVDWYNRARAALVVEMGGVCATEGCGAVERLEFNHRSRRTWVARKANRWVRLARYRREWKAGQLDLRCRSCNARLGKPKARRA